MFRINAIAPVPAGTGRGRVAAFPLRALAVGESFAVPEDLAAKVRMAASNFKRSNLGWNYTTRSLPNGGVRLWRTA